VAQGDDAGPRKRRDVHHGLGLEALGVAQGIGKNEASFRIRIENLDGLADMLVTISPGLVAAPPGMFSQVGSVRRYSV